jgi:glycosyltransferase involved in cell wall biosynthesis
MRRFAFVSTMEGSPWGGSEELWSQTAIRLAQGGHRVSASVAHSNRPRDALMRLKQGGVEVVERQGTAALWDRFWRRLNRRRAAGQLSRRDVSWLRAIPSGCVCVSQGGIADGLQWMLQCRSAGLPYVAIVQSNAEWLWPDDRQGEQMALAYGSAQACCFVSSRNRELLEDQIGRRLGNAVVVHNPYNVTHDASPTWPATTPEWRLACVARLDPVAKGQDVLLHVLAQDKWKTRDLRVAFYGTGRCERNLRQLAERLGLNRVEFRGHVSDVERIWADNHALVLPSRYEGTPLALVEAMLCGRPAIVTDVAGNTELVEHGISGFVACAPSVALLDHVFEEAWQRRSEWQEMGARARDRAAALVPVDPVGQFCELLIGME